MTNTSRARLGAIAAAVALAAALTSCSGESEQATGFVTSADAASSEAAEAPVHGDADIAFAQTMIVHHEGAIEMAELAIKEAASPEVQDLALGIADAQGPEIDRMTAWLEEWGASPAHDGTDHAGMDMDGLDQAGAVAELEGLDGVDFDRRFLELMIAHHEGAIVMAAAQIEAGTNREALGLARMIGDTQRAEIARMQELHDSL